jgi:hypothetical protein
MRFVGWFTYFQSSSSLRELTDNGKIVSRDKSRPPHPPPFLQSTHDVSCRIVGCVYFRWVKYCITSILRLTYQINFIPLLIRPDPTFLICGLSVVGNSSCTSPQTAQFRGRSFIISQCELLNAPSYSHFLADATDRYIYIYIYIYISTAPASGEFNRSCMHLPRPSRHYIDT